MNWYYFISLTQLQFSIWSWLSFFENKHYEYLVDRFIGANHFDTIKLHVKILFNEPQFEPLIQPQFHHQVWLHDTKSQWHM